MRVVLFIGHHKVGTSSLQRFLAENYHPFLKTGVLYPMVEFEGLTYQMAHGLNQPTDHTPLTFNVREAHNALAFKMMTEQSKKHKVPPYHTMLPHTRQMFHAISQQITFFEPHTMVLCAEVFANFAAMDIALIQRLSAIFDPEDVTIVATLRRPDEYITSWQGQRLKFGHKVKPLFEDGLDHYFGSIHFNYRKMLEGWAQEFPPGTSTWILRDYSDVLKSGGSIEDFLTQIGLKRPKNAVEVPHSNPSLPDALMEVARLGNNMLEPSMAQALRRYLMDAGSRLNLPKKSDIEHFGPENRARLLESFDPIHKWLQHLTGHDPFFKDMDQAAAVRTIPVTEATAKIIGTLQRDAAKHITSSKLITGLSDIAGAFA